MDKKNDSENDNMQTNDIWTKNKTTERTTGWKTQLWTKKINERENIQL